MRPLRVVVVGSGPAGLYTADALRFQKEVPFTVDLVDRLPTPFGLLRYGVAPDHLKMKSLAIPLQKVLDDERVRFLGNVECGRDTTPEELRASYDAVIWSFGAAVDRRLDIPGENLPGSVSATSFVAWYSGHPDVPAPVCSLDRTGAAIIGVGNVAVDVARILSRGCEELRQTDMPDEVLDLLAGSEVTDVYMLGRRGPVDARFTTKELRELGELAGVDVVVRPEDLELDDRGRALLAEDEALARNYQVLTEWSQRSLTGAPRRLHLRFLVRPVEVLGTDRVNAITVERCTAGPDGAPCATGQLESLDVGLVLRAVGCRGRGLDGVPFDAATGTIPVDDRGRVLRDGTASPGEYAVGWIKRGATGVLGTNRSDAQVVVDTMLADAPSLLERGRDDVPDLAEVLTARGSRVVTTQGWTSIDAAEAERGAAQGRKRVKIHRMDELLAAGGHH